MARVHTSGMFASEKAIMDLWDVGFSTDDIAVKLGKGREYRSYVAKIVSRYSEPRCNSFERMSRQGTDALLNAIRLHHPERVGQQ